MQQENDTPREKNVAKNLEVEEKSSNFAPADDENGQRLQVNITQNAGEEGSPNRMGDLNEKDRVAYKNALETLRRKDISDEQRNAAEAVMVVVPTFLAVTLPFASPVATAGSLLEYVTSLPSARLFVAGLARVSP